MKKRIHLNTLVIISCILIGISICISACKKDTRATEQLNPLLHHKNLEYQNGTEISEINLAKFKSKVNQSALGLLKKTFNINDAPNRLMSIDLPETYAGFAIQTEHIKLIVANGHTSYVFPVKLNSPHAVTFQNLTIDESKDGTFAFVTSYTPTQAWIADWKVGKAGKFDGLIELTPLNLQNGLSPANHLSLKPEKLSSLSPLPKTALAQVCNTVTYYYSIPYKCASGQHNPGEPCGLEGSDRAGYVHLSNAVTTCYDVDNTNPGDGGGGGGGNTTPNPDPDYDPCPKTPPSVEFIGVRGERLAVAAGTPICDLQPLPPAPNLRDTAMQAEFFKNAKAMCALAKLMENNFFKKTINNFIGETKPIDLSFKLENIVQDPGFKTRGETKINPTNWSSTNIDLTIANNLIDDMPSIEVALTLLHEGIHAEIYRKLLTIHGPSNLNNLNFPSMFNLYSQYKLSQGFSHEYMANYYVNTIAEALRQYDKNKFDAEYYKAYAWDGLKDTDYFNSLTDAQKASFSDKKNNLLANRSKQACND